LGSTFFSTLAATGALVSQTGASTLAASGALTVSTFFSSFFGACEGSFFSAYFIFFSANFGLASVFSATGSGAGLASTGFSSALT
jgi:hypothetical protein